MLSRIEKKTEKFHFKIVDVLKKNSQKKNPVYKLKE